MIKVLWCRFQQCLGTFSMLLVQRSSELGFLRHFYDYNFITQLTWQWSMNMIKVLWLRFQKWLESFTMLLVIGSSETGLLTDLSNHVFGVRNYGNTKALRDIFFFKCLKSNLHFKNAAKNWVQVFCFSDNFIWIGIITLSLLRIGYLSSAANGLTSSTKI